MHIYYGARDCHSTVNLHCPHSTHILSMKWKQYSLLQNRIHCQSLQRGWRALEKRVGGSLRVCAERNSRALFSFIHSVEFQSLAIFTERTYSRICQFIFHISTDWAKLFAFKIEWRTVRKRKREQRCETSFRRLTDSIHHTCIPFICTCVFKKKEMQFIYFFCSFFFSFIFHSLTTKDSKARLYTRLLTLLLTSNT